MKKLSIGALAATLLMAACSPQVYPLYLDVRQPSTSGLDLSRKSMSIVYMDGTQPSDTAFDRSVASAMARSLEADYFNSEQVVGLYHIPAADTVSVDLMHKLVMDTEGDVVFLLSSHLGDPIPETNQVVRDAKSADSAYVCPVKVPVSTVLRIYDSMGDDKVQKMTGSTVLRPIVYNNGVTTEDGLKSLALRSMDVQGEEIGKRISNRFLSRWKSESFSFYYFDGMNSDVWLDALQLAADGHFAKAVDAWTPLVKSGSAVKRACAAFNIAQAFYLMDNFQMSQRWLDMARKLENVSLGAGLQKRIDARLEKL